MGGGTSRNIEYNSFTSEEQLKVLEDFKLTYADKSKKNMTLVKTIYTPYEYIVYSNKYKIKFKQEIDLIDFVSEIGRPFVIAYIDGSYSINFVYGKNLK